MWMVVRPLSFADFWLMENKVDFTTFGPNILRFLLCFPPVLWLLGFCYPPKTRQPNILYPLLGIHQTPRAFTSEVFTFTKLQTSCSYTHPPFLLWQKTEQWKMHFFISIWRVGWCLCPQIQSSSISSCNRRSFQLGSRSHQQERRGRMSHPLTKPRSSGSCHILMK